MLNRINPLEQIKKYNYGGEVSSEEGGAEIPSFFEKPESSPEEDSTQMGMAALMDALGEDRAAELQAAIQQFPVVQDIAMMAVHTGDGAVQGMETGETDEVPARLEPGEFIFSKPAVDVIGLEELERIHEEARRMAGTM